MAMILLHSVEFGEIRSSYIGVYEVTMYTADVNRYWG